MRPCTPGACLTRSAPTATLGAPERNLAASQAPHAPADAAPAAGRFVLYLEGPRDPDILGAWAWRVSPALARALGAAVVILGGRQPARAAEHLRNVRAADPRARGLCVLDRDDGAAPQPSACLAEDGLEVFTWGRRHIESYLLVPDALLRTAGLQPDDPRSVRLLRGLLPRVDDEAAHRDLHAKTLLAEGGALARALGRPLPPGRIARQMDRRDLHPDVLDVLSRIATGIAGAPATAGTAFPLPEDLPRG